jgi:hypothetical protein
MSEVRQALTGILAALISAVIILGSIVLALSETGQKLASLPESSAESSTPMPPPPTSKPGEPTYTTIPTRLPQTATSTDSFNCPLPPGWERKEAFPDDTWESLARQSGESLDRLLEANCLAPEDIRNSKLGYGIFIALPKHTSTPATTLAQTATATATATPTRATPQPTKARSAQSKPKATTCSGHPAGWVLYTVRSGDTLIEIGRMTGVNWVTLRNANCLPSSLIRTGQRLWVPRLPVIIPVRTATPRPTRTATLTRTSPPTTRPPDTVVPPTERPTDPPPSNTPVVPTPTSPPTAYP